MAEKEKEKVQQNIPAMLGTFKLCGVVEKLDKSKFETKTQTQKDKRALNIGLRTSKDNLVFVNMSAVVQKDVYFSKRSDDGKSSETKIVPWDERLKWYDDSSDGFLPMTRISIGVKQTVNDKGEKENDTRIRIPFDALKHIYDYVEIGDELTISGNVSVESYFTQSGEKKNIVRLNPTRIYKMKKELNFEDENFVEKNEIIQKFITNDVELDEENKRAIIYADVIGQKREGVMEIQIQGEQDYNFAKNFKIITQSNPYMAVTAVCKIVNEGNFVTEEKTWDDFFQTWVTAPKRTSSGSRTKYMYVNLEQGSRDDSTYTAENVEEFRNTFCKGQEEFGKSTEAGDVWDSI